MKRKEIWQIDHRLIDDRAKKLNLCDRHIESRGRKIKIVQMMDLFNAIKIMQMMDHLRAGQASLSDTHFAGI